MLKGIAFGVKGLQSLPAGRIRAAWLPGTGYLSGGPQHFPRAATAILAGACSAAWSRMRRGAEQTLTSAGGVQAAGQLAAYARRHPSGIGGPGRARSRGAVRSISSARTGADPRARRSAYWRLGHGLTEPLPERLLSGMFRHRQHAAAARRYGQGAFHRSFSPCHLSYGYRQPAALTDAPDPQSLV